MIVVIGDDEATSAVERDVWSVGAAGVEVQANEFGDVFGGGLASHLCWATFLDDSPVFEHE